MARTKNTPATEAQAETDTVEAVEAQQPEGVTETEDQAAAEPVQNTPGQYLVVWHIKAGGQRFAPGDVVDLEPAAAEPFLASGAITAQQ